MSKANSLTEKIKEAKKVTESKSVDEALSNDIGKLIDKELKKSKGNVGMVLNMAFTGIRNEVSKMATDSPGNEANKNLFKLEKDLEKLWKKYSSMKLSGL